MDDFLGVNISDAIYNSIHKGLDFRGDEVGPDSYEFVEWLVLTQLQEDIDIIFIFKAMVKLNYIGMMQGLMKFNLICQSKPSPVWL